MSVNEHEWMKERERLEHVQEEINKEISRLKDIVGYREATVLNIRRDFWDEVTVNTSDYSEIAETAASITQQNTLLSEQERTFRHAENTLRKLQKLQASPYFARVDFTEQGLPHSESIYIGIHSLVDEETHELYIYDWRAPISGMFYDYTPGPAKYETPDGVIEGEMTLKRQYMIKKGTLQDMFDTGIHIGDEMLQVMLAKSAHEKMSSIVMTIQQEQNRIIRDDQYDILIVQGSAGSGKTSVALQRVAYLLYKYRNTLSADQMVLFSPNSVFNDYVSNVLPELGEANMLQTTFQDHVDRGLGVEWQVEDAYDQLEHLLSAPDERRIQGIEWKSSLEFLELINHYIHQLRTEGIMFKDFVLKEKVLISGDQLTHLFYTEFSGNSSLYSRLEKLKEWILEELKTFEEKVFRNRFRKMLKDPRYLGTEEEMKAESRQVAKKAFSPLRKMARNLDFVDMLGMYKRLFSDFPLQKKLRDVAEFTLQQLNKGHIPFEDATPLLYFKSAFMGMSRVLQIRQVIIDEAQDYSPFQLEYIRRMFPHARFTMLGDLNQGIHHANVQSYQMLGELFQDARVGVVRMTKSYRSTQEITQFTKNILQSPEPIESIGRSGEAPRIIWVPQVDQLVKRITDGIHEMLQQNAVSIAVICKTEQETREVYERLNQMENQKLHLITKESFAFTSGIVVIPSYLAKGLEFDGVIIYNAGSKIYSRESERKLLYTACTRALHQLHVYYTGDLTPLIKVKVSSLTT